MKKGKGKKRSKAKKQVAVRFKSAYVKDKKDIPQRIIYPEGLEDKRKLEDSTLSPAIHKAMAELVSERDAVNDSSNVHCMNAHREAKGLAPITTPATVQDQRNVRDFIMSEARTYAKWADAKIDQRLAWEFEYQEKLAYRNEMAAANEEFMAERKMDLPIEPTITLVPESHRLPSPTPEKVGPWAGGYGFAKKKPKVLTGLAPSGLPISEFLNGGKYPPKKVEKEVLHGVTYPRSVKTPAEVAVEMGSNPSYTPSVADVKWHINNFAPSEWPEYIRDHARWNGTCWVADKSKIFGKVGMTLESQYEALERDYAKLQLELYVAKVDFAEQKEVYQETIGMLYEELSLADAHVKLSVLHGVTTEDIDSARSKALPLSVETLAQFVVTMKTKADLDTLHYLCVKAGLDSSDERRLCARVRALKVQANNVELDRRWCYDMASKEAKRPRVKDLNMARKRMVRNVRHGVKCHEIPVKLLVSAMFKERMFYRRLKRKQRPQWMSMLETRSLLNNALVRHREENKKYLTPVRVAELRALREARALTHRRKQTKVYRVSKKILDVLMFDVNPVNMYKERVRQKEIAAADKRIAAAKARFKVQDEQRNERNKMREAYSRAH